MNCDSLFGPGRIFPEIKAFVDIMPKRELRDILADYNRQKPQGTTALTAFLQSNFSITLCLLLLGFPALTRHYRHNSSVYVRRGFVHVKNCGNGILLSESFV